MENEGGAHLIMDYTKGESSQASDLASLTLTGSKDLESYYPNKDSEGKRGQDYGTTSECENAKPRDGIRDEWLNLEVSYTDIKGLTDNFSESLVIGKGGFGKVYRANLGGRTVAIKILDSTSTQGQREFFQEIEVLHNMRHPHLVELVGTCFEEVRALVYEFLPNGSLEDCLKESPETLTWQMRTRIIYEICLALSYLHSKSVIHADLKPANVLLDANFKSKLSDFGLCRFLPKDMTTAPFLETGPMGTLGYTDPWFLERCILRPGSDLYSLGVTILRLLTRMSPIDLGWKIRETDENSLRKMIDPTAGNWPFELAKEMVYWSLQCCFHNQNSSAVLMDMSTCLQGILAEMDTLQGGTFKPGRAIRYGSRGLEPPSHDRGKKEVVGATNPFSSSFSSEVDETLGISGGKMVYFDGSFEFEVGDLLLKGKNIYGKLYMTPLEDGNEVAVRRFKHNIVKGQREFESEVNVLGNARHKNLLAIRGYCFDPNPDGEKLLVFDPMPKGNLADILYTKSIDFTWSTTINIAMGIARGLNYLHDEMNIIHGNLTGYNILLSEETSLIPKISDYELSRLITAPVFSKVTAHAAVLGYRAPELEEEEEANKKSDVYSLGMIILVLLTGKTAGSKLVELVRQQFGKNLLCRSLMKNGVESKKMDAVLDALKLGSDCVDPLPASRPEVQQVLLQLGKIQDAYHRAFFLR